MKYPNSFENLIDSLKKLPGVGPKSAERMAYQILDMSEFDIKEFSQSLVDAKSKLHSCSICGHMTEDDICDVCKSSYRDKSVICVVQSSKDVFAIEKTKEYNGVYHVLHGAIAPMNGIGPQDLNIASLVKRIDEGGVKEVILATNPTTEGETTSLYLNKILGSKGVEISRIAYGVPMGANLDYTDEYTLLKSLQGRKPYNK